MYPHTLGENILIAFVISKAYEDFEVTDQKMKLQNFKYRKLKS